MSSIYQLLSTLVNTKSLSTQLKLSSRLFINQPPSGMANHPKEGQGIKILDCTTLYWIVPGNRIEDPNADTEVRTG